jgi:hypothetical protein
MDEEHQRTSPVRAGRNLNAERPPARRESTMAVGCSILLDFDVIYGY